MFFNQDRQQMRQQFVDCWAKHKKEQPLLPVEKQIVDVIEEHPEYHDMLTDPDALYKEFSELEGISNPFLHMGMHLALREQVGTDRPAGIKAVTRSLLLQYGDGHQVEHRMMDCLAMFLWDAQQQRKQPDEKAYLEALKKL